MESIERLQHRIDSLQELQSIVRTMKALSAVSVQQYDRAVRSLADYYRTVELGLNVVLGEIDDHPPPNPQHRQDRQPGVIIFGSDHGLCGRFNEEIADFARQNMAALSANANRKRILAVGARAAAILEHAGEMIEEDFQVPGSAARITATVQQILLKIDEWRSEEGIEDIYLYYNHHKEKGYQPTELQLLPVQLHEFRQQAGPWPSHRLPTYSMPRKQLLSALLRQYFFVTIFRACAESQASEHTSRLTAMQAADKNLGEKLEEITTLFHRLRQETITTELLDIVSGYEAILSENS